MNEFKNIKDEAEVEWDWPADRASSKPTYFPLGRSKKIGRIRINQALSHKQIVSILLLLGEDKVEYVRDTSPRSESSKHLLTQEEAAARLRCSAATVKRLRLTGRLKYIPGRPTLIRIDDLEDFERGAARFNLQDEESTARPSPSPEEQAGIDAAARARRALLLRKIAGPIKRTRLTDEEKARREAFRQDQRKKRQRAVLRRAAKARTKPETP